MDREEAAGGGMEREEAAVGCEDREEEAGDCAEETDSGMNHEAEASGMEIDPTNGAAEYVSCSICIALLLDFFVLRQYFGRQRKKRIKGCLEGGGGKKPSEKETELGHRKNSPKCPLNGTKKKKRKPRKNATKAWFPSKVSTPNRASTSEAILQDSPGMVTRRRLAMLMGEGASSQPPTMATSTPTKQATPKKIAKKITPKKIKKA